MKIPTLTTESQTRAATERPRDDQYTPKGRNKTDVCRKYNQKKKLLPDKGGPIPPAQQKYRFLRPIRFRPGPVCKLSSQYCSVSKAVTAKIEENIELVLLGESKAVTATTEDSCEGQMNTRWQSFQASKHEPTTTIYLKSFDQNQMAATGQ